MDAQYDCHRDKHWQLFLFCFAPYVLYRAYLIINSVLLFIFKRSGRKYTIFCKKYI